MHCIIQRFLFPDRFDHNIQHTAVEGLSPNLQAWVPEHCCIFYQLARGKSGFQKESFLRFIQINVAVDISIEGAVPTMNPKNQCCRQRLDFGILEAFF